jgi:hypothetical protein
MEVGGMVLDFLKTGAVRVGFSQVAVALIFSAVGCSSGAPTTTMNPALAGFTNGTSGTGVTPAPATSGAAGAKSNPPAPTGTGGAKAMTGAAGAAPPTGMAGAKSTAGAGGTGAMAGAGGSTSGGTAGSTGGDSGPSGSPCLDMIKPADYGNDGPFQVKMENSGAVNFWVPAVPAGCKVPVIHLANGTGASCASYGVALNRMATHGFLACCYEDPNTGAGDQGVMAFDAAFMKYPDLAAKKLGSTGHSQGGQAAFTVMALAEKKFTDVTAFAGLAMEPASGFGTQPTGATWQQLYMQIKGPMFMFSGTPTDGLVSQAWVQQAFDALDPAEEAYFWTRAGATHIPVPNGEEQIISIPWFRWKLLGDNEACKAFKTIPMMDTTWVEAAVKNAKMCL